MHIILLFSLLNNWRKYMRKLLAFIIIIINIVLISSCGLNNTRKNAEATKMNNEKQTEESIEVRTEEVVKDKEIDKDFSSDLYSQNKVYSIAPSELLDRDLERPDDNTEWTKSLTIMYPQLYNMEDGEKQKKINDLIFKKVITHHNILENRDYIEYHIDYKIMHSDDEFFSILFTGEVSDYRSSNRFAFGITINIEDGVEMSLESFFKVDKFFVKNYLFSKFDVVENNFKDVSENIPYVERYIDDYSDNPHINDFYIKEDTLGMIIPTYNSMGYIIIEGKLE